MNVGSCGSMEKMGNMFGGGQGQGGMKDIMQSLSTEERATMKEQLSSMTQEERTSAVTQMKEVDKASLSAQDYTQALLDILTQSDTEKAESDGFSVYA